MNKAPNPNIQYAGITKRGETSIERFLPIGILIQINPKASPPARHIKNDSRVAAGMEQAAVSRPDRTVRIRAAILGNERKNIIARHAVQHPTASARIMAPTVVLQ